jgi:ribosomal protein L31
MALTIASNNKIATTKNSIEVVDQLDVSEKLHPFLSDGDRRYMSREGENIAVLTAKEKELAKEIADIDRELKASPAYQKMQRQKANLKRTRILIDEKVTKVRGVVERALQDTKKGAKLADKLDDLITLPTSAPKALKEKN